VSPSQLALAWLLRRSPVILPIPGTSKVAHLEENLRAAAIELAERDIAAIRGCEVRTPRLNTVAVITLWRTRWNRDRRHESKPVLAPSSTTRGDRP
jgi:diketogulonate reductase-like aldo/keto reductase